MTKTTIWSLLLYIVIQSNIHVYCKMQKRKKNHRRSSGSIALYMPNKRHKSAVTQNSNVLYCFSKICFFSLHTHAVRCRQPNGNSSGIQYIHKEKDQFFFDISHLILLQVNVVVIIVAFSEYCNHDEWSNCAAFTAIISTHQMHLT